MKTIKASSEISLVFDKGKRYNAADLSIIVLRNEKQHDQEGRVAFIAGKKLGNAVWRNRAKRRMRSICFDLGGPFPAYDVLFIARKNTGTVLYDELAAQAKTSLIKAHVIGKQSGNTQ